MSIYSQSRCFSRWLSLALLLLAGATSSSAIQKQGDLDQRLTFREQRLLDKIQSEKPKATKETPPTIMPRIVGGDTATKNDYPWMVGLLDRATSDRYQAQYCGAALIHPYWVLTAAHCVEGDSTAVIDALIGGYNLDSSTEGERLEVVEVIMHPDFDPTTFDSDIALLRLASPSSAPVLRLNSDAALEQPDTLAAVIGWGALDEENSTFPSVLQDVFIPLVSLGTANAASRYDGELTTNMLAAGNLSIGGIDSCQGDSGGPLVLQDLDGEWTLSGVVSFGYGCGDPDFPGIYTRVSQFRTWVLQHVLPKYADWEVEMDVFGEARDFDADTQSNFHEFALNLNPRQFDLGNGVVATSTDSLPAFQMSRPLDDGAEVQYVISYTPSLTNLDWTELDYSSQLKTTELFNDRELLTFNFPEGAAGFVCVQPQPADALACAARHIALGRESYSNLTPELRTDGFGRLYQEFLITDISAGVALNITGVSDDFDLGIELYDHTTGALLRSSTSDNYDGNGEQFEYTPSSGFLLRAFAETTVGSGAYWISVRPPYSGTSDSIGYNETVTDSLTRSDEVDPIFSDADYDYYKKDYYLDTPIGYSTPIVVTLISDDFDAYLIIVNATTGEFMDANDDIDYDNGNYNSRLTIDSSDFGNVLIRVSTSFDGEIGGYRLTTSPQ